MTTQPLAVHQPVRAASVGRALAFAFNWFYYLLPWDLGSAAGD
jgi:hypothetical protein